MFVDTHCHLGKKYYFDIDNIIKKAIDKGVKFIIISGYDRETNKEVIELAKKYENVYATIGYGPSIAENVKDEDLELLKEQGLYNKIVGIGEIGLDYYRNKYKDKQKDIFIKQIEIANELNKPIVVHNRDADDDVYNILKEAKLNKNGVIHCFNSDYLMGEKFIKLGFYLGIGGIITFKNSKLAGVIKKIPLEYIVLETDSPYLAPEPHRGEKNDPSLIKKIAEKIADLKEVNIENVGTSTTINALRLFDLQG